MYPPALKGLFNFLSIRPHTHDCNYVRQRSVGGSSAVTGLHLALDRSIHFHSVYQKVGMLSMPFQQKQNNDIKETGKWIGGISLCWTKEKKRALIKNKEIKKQQTVTEKRWKEKHNKIKPRRPLSAPWLQLISREEERKCCCMEIQPGRPAAGRGGDAEWTGRQKPHNSGNEGGILLHTATESLKKCKE